MSISAQTTQKLTATKASEYGIIYTLPSTVVDITIETEKIVKKPGEFYRYAKKYFNANNAIEAEANRIASMNAILDENYNMIAEYPIEEWNGGKVRHIVRDKIILLERGQVFEIDGKKIFTFGGASSHDVQGGILDKSSPTYMSDYERASKSGLPFRVLDVSWWKQELPTEEELQEGRDNLAKVDYKVDYVITHCAANRIQYELELYKARIGYSRGRYQQDILTNYFEELEEKLEYTKWFCGHYHDEFCIDEKHTILYHKIIPIED